MDTGRNSQANYKNMGTTFRDSYRAPSDFNVLRTLERRDEFEEDYDQQHKRTPSQMTTNRTFKQRLLRLDSQR